MLLDARHALRMLANNRAFTVVSVLTLALGIGAATAIFTVVNSVLLEPLRYRDAGRIVSITTKWKHTGRINPRLTGGDLVDIRQEDGVFEALSPYVGGEVGVQLGGEAQFTGVSLVNAGFFHVFGVLPIYGRTFNDDEAERAAMVGLAFATRNFGSGAGALGKTLKVENRAYEIVGVLPPGLQFPDKCEVWVAAPVTPDNLNRTAYNYRAVARLKAGRTLDGARARLETVGARLEAAYPDSNRNKTFAAIPLQEQMVGPVRSTLLLFLGAVGLVLLIACANVANLLLARTPSRAREIAVRAALGASRWRIIRQLTIENVLLAAAATALGVAFAHFGVEALLRLAPENLPRIGEVRMHRTALAFAVLVSMASSLLFGLAPAWHASRVEARGALKQGGSRGVIGRGSGRLRNALVIAEIALSFVLAIGAGLLFRSFMALTTVELGYRAEGILVMYAHAPARTMQEHLQVGRLYQNLLGELREIPGVLSSAAAMGLPGGRYGSNGSYAVEGKHVFAAGSKMPHAGFRLASPGYFSAMGIPLVRGRDFTAQDVYDAPFVAVVSQALVRDTFPDENPIGRRIQLGLDSPEKWVTIVGVAGNVRQDSPASAPYPEIYMPLQQHPFYGNEVQVVVRTSMPPASLAGVVRERVQAAIPETATKFTTMRTLLADSIATPRFRMALVAVFAGLALLLAMGGVYGVMTYITVERTAEMGVRIALGATSRDVMRLILARAVLLAAIGLTVGLAASVALSGLVASMLFGLEPTDTATYVGVSVALALTTLAAAAMPAWRAGRIDPAQAIREE
ncbi:MAG: ABC transporter permease [Bryobacteraceae bacterium]